MSILRVILLLFRALFRDRSRLALENLALRKHYVSYYNVSRPHLSLERNAPMPRSVEPPTLGAVVAVSQVGGLHHRYARAAGARLHHSELPSVFHR